MSISQVSNTSNTPEIVEQGSNSSMDKTAFLKLLTVQLQNQDPTSPMDSNAMANQQVMYAELEQMMNLNENMSTYMESQEKMLTSIAGVFNTMESTSFLGKDVAVFTDEVQVDEDGNVGELYYDLTQSAKIGYTVKDSSGNTIRTVTKSEIESANQISVGWDGKDGSDKLVEAGTYTVTLNAEDSDGKELSGKTYGSRRVESVGFQSGAPLLTLADGSRIDLSSVLAIAEPEEK